MKYNPQLYRDCNKTNKPIQGSRHKLYIISISWTVIKVLNAAHVSEKT